MKLAGLEDEVSALEPHLMTTPPGGSRVMFQGERIACLATAAVLGSDDAAKGLSALAASEDRESAMEGKMGQKLAAWVLANGDEKAQSRLLDDIEALARDNPASDALATNLIAIKRLPGLPAEFAQRIDALFLKTLDGPVAAGVQADLDAGMTQKNAIGKPMVLAGKTLEGQDFSTKEYGGKVILVDFWATWCGPCVAEMPRIKAMYEKYHDRGLEIVGISYDGDGEKLAKFTKESNMPWVQFWDKDKQSGKSGAAHPLAVEWKVNGIPQMFLIDRKGILRVGDRAGGNGNNRAAVAGRKG